MESRDRFTNCSYQFHIRQGAFFLKKNKVEGVCYKRPKLFYKYKRFVLVGL